MLRYTVHITAIARHIIIFKSSLFMLSSMIWISKNYDDYKWKTENQRE